MAMSDCKMIGMLAGGKWDTCLDIFRRVYDVEGCSPALVAMSAGEGNRVKIEIKQATKEGKIECEVGGVCDLSYPNSETRRGRVQENGEVSPTLMTSNADGICRIEQDKRLPEGVRVRSLTEREYFRLMGVRDEDFELVKKRQSRAKLYHLAGDSIVVDVLMAIFKPIVSAQKKQEEK